MRVSTHAHNFVLNNRVDVNHITNRIGNRMIERYHATFRERDKVIRGFKSEKTADKYTENWRTYYNYVKPRMALNGLTL